MACVLVALLVLVAASLYKFLTRNFDYWEKRGVEFVKPTILVGNLGSLITFRKSIGDFLGDLCLDAKADYFGIWFGNTPNLILKSPEVIKAVLVKDFNHFAFRGVCNDIRADPVFSRMLFSSEPEYWRAMRAHLSPIFSSAKLKSMIPLINAVGEEMQAYLSKNCATTSGRSQARLELKELCAKFTTDVVTSCAFGVDGSSFRKEDAEFRELGRKMFGFTMSNALRSTCYFFIPSLVRLFKFTFFDPSVNEFCRDYFWNVVNQREASGRVRNDVVDALIKMKNVSSSEGFTFEGDCVVAQAQQFFAAGFETTSSTITFALYELALNEELQAVVRKEVHEAFKQGPTITYDSTTNTPMLDKVIKETLRKYPALPFLNRECIKDYKMPNSDVVIEKGTPVQIPMFGVHYDPEHFPKPDVFDPERFSDENAKSIPQCAYIPFGEGPHNCIGARLGLMMTKLGLFHVLNKFQVRRNNETPIPLTFDPKSFVLQVKDGIPIDFVLGNNVDGVNL